MLVFFLWCSFAYSQNGIPEPTQSPQLKVYDDTELSEITTTRFGCVNGNIIRFNHTPGYIPTSTYEWKVIRYNTSMSPYIYPTVTQPSDLIITFNSPNYPAGYYIISLVIDGYVNNPKETSFSVYPDVSNPFTATTVPFPASVSYQCSNDVCFFTNFLNIPNQISGAAYHFANTQSLQVEFGDGTCGILMNRGTGGALLNCSNAVSLYPPNEQNNFDFDGTFYHTYLNPGYYTITMTSYVMVCQVYNPSTGEYEPIVDSYTFPIWAGPPQVALTASENPICANASLPETISAEVNSNTPVTYQWATSAGALTETTSAIDISETENTTYFVTVTDQNGCSGTASIDVTINDCCTTTEGITLTNTTASNVSYLFIDNNDGTYSFNPYFANSEIVINHHFIVDLPLVIGGFPNIRLGEATVIDVTEGNTLVLDNSTLQGCDNLWYGISITGAGFSCNATTCPDYNYNGASVIMRNGATIRDAGFGIESHNGSYYDIDGGNFIDNYMGIAVYDCDGFEGRIINSVFSADNQFLAPPLETLPPTIGIFAASVDGIEIGDALGNFNEFSHIVNGINSIASNMTVHPNMFHDLVESPDPDADPYESTGIIAWNIFNHYQPTGSITVTGFDPDPDNNSVVNFSNMKNGIVMQAVDAEVSGNNFENMENVGMWVVECNNAEVGLSNNKILNASTGISYVTNNNIYSLILNNRLIYDNSVGTNTLGIGTSGISIAQLNQPVSFIGIGSNRFYNHRRNIDLLSTGDNLSIGSNYFEMKRTVDNGKQIGIRATNCELPEISTNQFVGLPSAISDANTSAAIRLRNTTDAVIECNDMDYTSAGLLFEGDNFTNSEAIRTNRFHRHFNGIQLRNFGAEGLIGDVGATAKTNGNIFATPNSSYHPTGHIRTTSTNPSPNPPAQIFYFDPIDGTLVSTGSPLGIAMQIQQITGNDRFDCTVDFDELFDMQEGGGSGERMMAEGVATGEAYENVEPEYREVSKYEQEKSTYRRLDRKPQLRTESEVLDDFYTEKQTGAVGKMDDMKQTLRQLADSVITSDSSLYAAKVLEVQTKLAALATAENFEYNEKRVAEIYTQTAASGIPLYKDLQAKNYINWLAHQCPLVEGHSVYEARSLYAQISPNEDYDDDVLCDGMFKKERETENEVEELASEITLRPNPAKHYVTWFYKLSEEQKAVITVTNQLGETVFKGAVPSGQFSYSLHVDAYAAGVYNYLFSVDGKPAKRDKFVVIK